MKKSLTSYSDLELVKKLNEKSEDSEKAFNEIYLRYAPMVHSYCVRVMENADKAEDIFQEAFIRFYQNIKSDSGTLNVPGYLMTVTRNLCLNAKRDKKQTVQVEEVESLLYETNDYEKSEMLQLIKMALELLDFEYKEAFVLREYNGLAYEEIANLCQITVSNAKSRVFRAKQKIKEILVPYLKDSVN